MGRKLEAAKANAKLSYETKMAEAAALLARIHAEVLAKLSAPERCHWGHAGDAAKLVSDLQQISDAMFSEGEYAVDAR